MRPPFRQLLVLSFLFGFGVAAAELREMQTDRPDVTESPFTIDPGHLQLESSFFEYGNDRRTPEGSGTRTKDWSIAPTNLRLGLTNRTEVGVIIEPLIRRSTSNALHTERQSGVGDITVRPKVNFWGDDGGPTAFGLMPFVKIPTNTHDLGNNHVEGGVILPFACHLDAGWDLGAMTEVDLIRNQNNSGYTSAWVNTLTLGHPLSKKLGGYLELTSTASEGPHAMTLDGGLTYAVNENLQLDAGVNLGLTRAAEDIILFTGISRRF
jgi:Putative MetA-pathway of phenol degradation